MAELGEPRAKLALPRLRNEKDIFLAPPVSSEENQGLGRYVATVKLSKVLKGHRIERLFGRVKSLYVFESPLPID